jgi:hypothetical protein
MFITLTHSSQMRDEKVRRMVKAYTSKHNQRHQEKRARQNQVKDYPSPSFTDEEQEQTPLPNGFSMNKLCLSNLKRRVRLTIHGHKNVRLLRSKSNRKNSDKMKPA